MSYEKEVAISVFDIYRPSNQGVPLSGLGLPIHIVYNFGLGRAAMVESLEIQWPGGEREKRTGVAVDRVLALRE